MELLKGAITINCKRRRVNLGNYSGKVYLRVNSGKKYQVQVATVVIVVGRMVKMVKMLSTLVVHLSFLTTLASSQVAVVEVEVVRTTNAPTRIHTIMDV